jgi:hypothetical protein
MGCAAKNAKLEAVAGPLQQFRLLLITNIIIIVTVNYTLPTVFRVKEISCGSSYRLLNFGHFADIICWRGYYQTRQLPVAINLTSGHVVFLKLFELNSNRDKSAKRT